MLRIQSWFIVFWICLSVLSLCQTLYAIETRFGDIPNDISLKVSACNVGLQFSSFGVNERKTPEVPGMPGTSETSESSGTSETSEASEAPESTVFQKHLSLNEVGKQRYEDAEEGGTYYQEEYTYNEGSLSSTWFPVRYVETDARTESLTAPETYPAIKHIETLIDTVFSNYSSDIKRVILTGLLIASADFNNILFDSLLIHNVGVAGESMLNFRIRPNKLRYRVSDLILVHINFPTHTSNASLAISDKNKRMEFEWALAPVDLTSLHKLPEGHECRLWPELSDLYKGGQVETVIPREEPVKAPAAKPFQSAPPHIPHALARVKGSFPV